MHEKRNIEQELLADLEAIKAHRRGEVDLRTRPRTCLRLPIFERMYLSQYEFAGYFGVSVRTVQKWEQGRR